MSITAPGELYIDNATFEHNEAASGGAAFVVATTLYGEPDLVLKTCTFEANNATNGGALYLFNNARGVSVAASVFRHNVAGECKLR